MCDQFTLKRIEKMVEQRMTAGRMFTAFDVTLALQKKGIRKLHREVRSDINRVAHNLMWRFRYERTLVSFCGIGASAFVYHPCGADASSHRPSAGPRALAPADSRRRSPAIKDVMQSGVNEEQHDLACTPDEPGRVFSLSPSGEAETALDIASGLFIIVKRRDRDVN